MRKKILAAGICSAIALALCACGSNEKTYTQSEVDAMLQEKDNEESSGTAEASEAAKEESAAVEPEQTEGSEEEPEKEAAEQPEEKSGNESEEKPEGGSSPAQVESGKTADLLKGDYIGGADIPAGTYTLHCQPDEDDYGIVWLSCADDDLENEYPSLLYEFIDADEEWTFFIPLEEGGTLHIPFECELTAEDYDSFADGETMELGAGTYCGGESFPAGMYEVTYDSGDKYGIIWLAEAGDDLDNEYPSLIYENINAGETGSFFISLGEGRKAYFPMEVTAAKIGTIDFGAGAADLSAGAYSVGSDIPAGRYNIVCNGAGGSQSGIMWASSPEDDLDNEYPSVLYDFCDEDSTDSFTVDLEEGGILYLPLTCSVTLTGEGGVVFE